MQTIGIDIGTSAVKVVAMDTYGRILRQAARTYPINMFGDGCSEQNPEDWWQAVCDASREVCAGLSEIRAVSFSGQMHGLVALDKAGQVLRPAILWNDQRTVAQCDYLNNAVGRENLIANTANIALTGFTLPKILWVAQHEPQIFERIAKIMLPKDYIAYMLCGEAATDVSDASGTLLLDVGVRQWSAYMLGKAGLTPSQLPRLYESFDVVGKVNAAAAELTGLPEGTLVVAGGGDQAVGAVGCGVVQAGMASVSLGTSGVLFAAADTFNADTSPAAIHSFCHANGQYHFMGVTLSAAGSNKWWAEDILGTADFAALQDGMSADTPSGLIFLPYLSGERTPINDPFAKGAFVGMTSTTTRTDMCRAVMEGVCYSLCDVLAGIRDLGTDPTHARIIGGGAKSPIWCQMMADCLNIRLERVQAGEGPAFGAAILAMVGAGAFDSVTQACKELVRTQDEFVPNPRAAAQYQEYFGIYKAAYAQLKGVYSTLNTLQTHKGQD